MDHENNTTVTLPLKYFDELRDCQSKLHLILTCISDCFEYTYKENPEPEECKNCDSIVDCPDCDVYIKTPPYEEKLTVDVKKLIATVKSYALYEKQIKPEISEKIDINSIPVTLSGNENGLFSDDDPLIDESDLPF